MKKFIASIFLVFSINTFAMTALTAAGALVGLAGAAAFVVGAPAVVSAAVVSIGLHAMGIGIALDDEKTTTSQGHPMPTNPDGTSTKGAQGSQSQPLTVTLEKSPLTKTAQIKGWADNPTTPKTSYRIPNGYPPIAGNKYPSLNSGLNAFASLYVMDSNARGSNAANGGYYVCDNSYVCAKDAQGNLVKSLITNVWGNLQQVSECADGYKLNSTANGCLLDLSDNEPKIAKKDDGTFQPHPRSTPTDPSKPQPTVKNNGKTIEAMKNGEGVIIQHNDDGTDTITNIKSTSSGGQVAMSYQIKDGIVIDSALIANESGFNDLNSNNSGLTKGSSIGTGTGTAPTGNGGGSTGNASGVASGVASCGRDSKDPCIIDDSGFIGAEGKAIAAVGQLQGAADKAQTDQLSLLDNATKNDLGMTSSWFPSLLPSNAPIDCKLMPISTSIIRGDINLTGSADIDLCDKLNIAREIMHWLFYVVTVFAIFRIFINSNKAAI
jgi:hypothetical protein